LAGTRFDEQGKGAGADGDEDEDRENLELVAGVLRGG